MPLLPPRSKSRPARVAITAALALAALSAPASAGASAGL